MRVDRNRDGLLKLYRGADDDEPSGVVAVRDGLFAFGSTGEVIGE